MEENSKKINFFKRVKVAIFKLEDYGLFLGEKISVSFKYFLLLIFILSLVIGLLDTYQFGKMTNKAYSYIQNELPDFTYENEKLNFEKQVEAYDHEYNFSLIIDTSENVGEEKLKEYKNKIYNDNYGIIALNDKFVYINNGYEQDYTYSEILEASSLTISNKSDLNKVLSQVNIPTVAVIFLGLDLFTAYITNVLVILSDVAVVAVFGYIASRFCGIKFKMLPMFSLSIYSLTLSIVLTAIYTVVYSLTGFVISYFNIVYLLIAYVYIIAAILMIKYDLIKQHFELERIIEVQKQVKEEIEEKKEEENTENKKPEDSNENNEKKEESEEEKDVNGREPDGSEI